MKKKPSTNLRSLYAKPKEPQEELIGALGWMARKEKEKREKEDEFYHRFNR